MSDDKLHAEMFPADRVWDPNDTYDQYEQKLRMQCYLARDDVTDAQINEYMDAIKAKHAKEGK